jgi:hypothetical protein
VIIDKSAEGRSGVLPYLPLPALGGGNPSAAAAVPAGGGMQPPSSDAANPPQPSNSGQQ